MGRAKMDLIERAVGRFRLMERSAKRVGEHGHGRVITISRQLGAGGRRIAEALGKELNLPVYDKEILELLAKKSGSRYRAQMFEELDEREQRDIEGMVRAFMGRVDPHRYFLQLPKVVLTLAQSDGIILGRAAHLFLPDSLKIRVEASLETRIENMILFEGQDRQEALRRIRLSDTSRERFARQLMARMVKSKRWFDNRLMYDVEINTDCFNVQQATAVVRAAAKERFGQEL